MSGGVFSGLSLTGATKPGTSLDQRLFDAPKEDDAIPPIVKPMPSEPQVPSPSELPASPQPSPPSTIQKPWAVAADTSDPATPRPALLSARASSSTNAAKSSGKIKIEEASAMKKPKKSGILEIPLDTARAERPLTEPASKSVARFDITEKPWRKDSFLFTDSEFDRLEDLKLELRRRFDLKATKNDIARVAFHGLFEEYSREPSKSSIVRHLRTKKS